MLTCDYALASREPIDSQHNLKACVYVRRDLFCKVDKIRLCCMLCMVLA